MLHVCPLLTYVVLCGHIRASCDYTPACTLLLPLSHIQMHTQKQNNTQMEALTRSCARARIPSLSLSLSPTLTLSLSLSHTHTHTTHPHSLTHEPTHSPTHPHIHPTLTELHGPIYMVPLETPWGGAGVFLHLTPRTQTLWLGEKCQRRGCSLQSV